MRTVPDSMKLAWESGDFTGENRAMCRVTCQHMNIKLYNTPHNLYASAIFGSEDIPKELPNLKSVSWSRSLDQDFASGTLVFYNTRPLRLGETPTRDLDFPGYYTAGRGKTAYSGRWKQQPNEFTNLLVPDNIIRTYEGYGFDPLSPPEKDTNLVQTGVWRIDEVDYDALGVMVTVTVRDIGSILGDQICFAPVIPANFYPLSFTAEPVQSGFVGPQVHTYTVTSGGQYDPKHPPPGGWAGPTTAPLSYTVTEGDRQLTISWAAVPTPTGSFSVQGYRVVLDDQPSAVTLPASARSYTVKKLTNGNVYSIQVQALYRETVLGAGTVNPHPGTTHTVVSGDTLWALAQFYYGDPNKWPVIARANGIDDSSAMDYAVRHLQIGEVLTIPAGPLPTPQPQDATGTLYRSEWGDMTTSYYKSPGVATAPTVAETTLVYDHDVTGDLHPNWIAWSYDDHGNYASWRVFAYRNGNPPKEKHMWTVFTNPGGTSTHVDTGGVLGDMSSWNYLVYGIQDNSTHTIGNTTATNLVGTNAPVGSGEATFRSDGHAGEFFAPPTAGVFPRAPGPTPKGQTIKTTTGATIPVKESRINMLYARSSNDPYIGDTGVYGHFPQDAFDGSDASYWLSIGNARPDQGYSFEWIEGAVNNATVTHVTFRTVNASAGAYLVYASVYAHGQWVSFSPGDIIPYNEYLPESHNGADIPYAGTYREARGGDEGPHTIVFKTPIVGAQRIRLTFYNLQNFGEFGYGGYPYRAALRYMQAFGYATTAQSSGPVVDNIYDNTSPEIVKTYQVYTPPHINPGAGEQPGKFEDYTDIVKLLAAWGGFFWPEHAKIVQSDGSIEQYDFGTGPFGLEFVDPVLGTQGSGRVWGDFETTGTASVATLTIDIFDKKSLMDGITYVRNVIGFNFFIDETGGVVWRNPNIYSLGNFKGDLSKDAGRVDEIIAIDEKQTLIGLSAKLSSRNVRERILVASSDGVNASLAQGYNPNPTGLRRVTIYSDMHFTSKSDAVWMADLVALNQLMTYRNDTVTIPGYPAIQIDDQVRIFEQVTSEGYIHYVRGISSNLDMESGNWTYQLTTQWLGEKPFNVWLFNPADMSAEFQQYVKALTYALSQTQNGLNN